MEMNESQEKPRVWDCTTIDMFQKCQKYYYWRMIKQLEKKEVSSALEFGKAIHSALDVHYTKGASEAQRVFSESYKDREGDETRTVENGLKVLDWYSKVYAKEPFTIVGKPEIGFVFPIGEIMWGGRMDLPVEWDGQLWVMEHKTTAYLNANYFKQFALDRQITSYCVAAEEYFGKKCAGCIINAIEVWKELKRPTVKSKRPEDHFVRDPVLRTSKLKDRFRTNVQLIVKDILECEVKGEFIEADRKDMCFSYNYDCPYRLLCEYGEDERIIEMNFARNKWEPYKTGEVE